MAGEHNYLQLTLLSDHSRLCPSSPNSAFLRFPNNNHLVHYSCKDKYGEDNGLNEYSN